MPAITQNYNNFMEGIYIYDMMFCTCNMDSDRQVLKNWKVVMFSIFGRNELHS